MLTWVVGCESTERKTTEQRTRSDINSVVAKTQKDLQWLDTTVTYWITPFYGPKALRTTQQDVNDITAEAASLRKE